MPLKPGDKLDQYDIVGMVGEGGMGDVYKAQDTKLGRFVAIKMSKSGELDERFRLEAKLLAALTHPNICTLYDVGPNYLVMEWIDGVTWKGPLPVDKALEHADQVLKGLDYAHRKGVTHRDLKPGNIMVTKDGIVKLLDFGIAKRTTPPSAAPVDDATRTALTKVGQVIGTPQYMAPELFSGGEADARSDIWAFGCVLYAAISGNKAFVPEVGGTLIGSITMAEPPPLDVAPALARVISTCLAKDPNGRFQNALDLKRNLVWAMEPPPVAIATPPVAIATPPPPVVIIQPPPPPKPNRWPWAVAVAAIILGALIGGWVMSRSRQAQALDQAHRFQLLPPEGGQFNTGSGFAISPDGRSLAFHATAPGKSGLWVRPMDATTARLLPGTGGGGVQPFWSPDGRSIAYWGATSKLWRVDVGGGAPIAICDTPPIRGGYWAPDGNIVFGTFASGLRRVRASGGTPEPLTTPDAGRGETSHRNPQMLPGARILFQVAGKPEQAGIYATAPVPSGPGSGSANPREAVRLVVTDGNGVYAAGHLLWLRGSTLVAQRFDPERLKLSGEQRPVADQVGTDGFGRMVAAASAGAGSLLVYGRSGASQLTWLDHAGKAAPSDKRAPGTPGNYLGWFRISPDGRRVAVSRPSSTNASGDATDLWMLDVERDAWSPFTFLPGFAGFPVWSPDGRQVVFGAGSPRNLHLKEASGAGTEQRVTESANQQTTPTDWSRDGRLVLYYERAPDTQRDLWVLPVAGGLPGAGDGKPEAGAKPRPYLRTRFDERHGRFSPESSPRWVAYTSDESGTNEVVVQAFPEPRGKFQISTGGGTYPEWSPDGRELYYMASGRKLMAAGLKLGADSLMPSTPRELFVLPAVGGGGFQTYALAPDGKRFLVLVPVGGSQPLEVVVNWTALLRQGSAPE